MGAFRLLAFHESTQTSFYPFWQQDKTILCRLVSLDGKHPILYIFISALVKKGLGLQKYLIHSSIHTS